MRARNKRARTEAFFAESRGHVGDTRAELPGGCKSQPKTWSFVVDNAPLAGWLNGQSKFDPRDASSLHQIFGNFQCMLSHQWYPWDVSGDWVNWYPRRFNPEADFVVNERMDNKTNMLDVNLTSEADLMNCALHAWSDGGNRCRGVSSAAAVVKAKRDDDAPVVMACVGIWLPDPEFDAMKAEVHGLYLATQLVNMLAMGRRLCIAHVLDSVGLGRGGEFKWLG